MSRTRAGHGKIYAIVEANATAPMRYLRDAPGPDGAPWTDDPALARLFAGREGFDFLGRAHERGIELAMLPLDEDVLSGEQP